jgi:hypothetical protein
MKQYNINETIIITMSEQIQFEILELPIPDIIKTYSFEQQQQIFNYLNEMDEYDKKAYKIAMNHLETSYNIYRSNGFKEWLKKTNK